MRMAARKHLFEGWGIDFQTNSSGSPLTLGPLAVNGRPLGVTGWPTRPPVRGQAGPSGPAGPAPSAPVDPEAQAMADAQAMAEWNNWQQ